MVKLSSKDFDKKKDEVTANPNAHRCVVYEDEDSNFKLCKRFLVVQDSFTSPTPPPTQEKTAIEPSLSAGFRRSSTGSTSFGRPHLTGRTSVASVSREQQGRPATMRSMIAQLVVLDYDTLPESMLPIIRAITSNQITDADLTFRLGVDTSVSQHLPLLDQVSTLIIMTRILHYVCSPDGNGWNIVVLRNVSPGGFWDSEPHLT
ncbi:hypothetical protein EV421DRAFT_763992 [Armillaria borealis]|uniref:Uncharacterized protein n=1 Tax=Armillaria borealis TaxID=47425 RepID=A0AA39MNU0_9AGAR|nr:hypothetical protein EV421DRAFT_763992 [Armillaria borealis]